MSSLIYDQRSTKPKAVHLQGESVLRFHNPVRKLVFLYLWDHPGDGQQKMMQKDLLGSVDVGYKTAFGVVRDGFQGAKRAAIRVLQAVCNTESRSKYPRPSA